ncbi:MAG: RdgB/HAM1 family non-canonical purine NTP pyrophosphatase [Sphingobacteriaceae bacterium]|nr:RdgB/HAM1 family non-canonical purine NTP pyrophosphatase [Sphingobacteriaceae bacterium]
MKTLLFASGNAHKIEEINAVLAPLGYQVQGLHALGLQEDIPETGTTLDENAAIKAAYLYEKFGKDCFADDTGLEVEALNGAPGVYSARYAGTPKSDANNMAKLLEAMAAVTNRKAQFRTVFCLIEAGEKHFFEGVVTGSIAEEPVGTAGFGYDPLFIPTGESRTFAQMAAAEKNKISHRARAVADLMSYLKKRL